MIANKVKGVFAAVCQDSFCAELSRSHSDTNVLCIGGKIIGEAIALEIIRVWMTTEWMGLTEEKYARRVNKVREIDNKHCR
jgi:ribose 5-phosphate isomerase B